MKSVCVIQARMGSTRLPGKVMRMLGDRTTLGWVIARCAASASFDAIAVATTVERVDDEIARHAEGLGAIVVRGDEHDVLNRYRLAARTLNAEIVTRITSDCPLIDPDVISAMMDRFLTAKPEVDILSNARVRTFPRGLDAEIFTREALEIAAAEAISPPHREHVTQYFYANPDRFRIIDYTQEHDRSRERWTLDTEDDYTLLCRIFASAVNPMCMRQADVIGLLNSHPDWRGLNAHVTQKS